MLYKLYILRAVLLGAIDPLLTMVRHGNAVGKENAAQALSLLALNADNKVRIAESCGIQVCITHACASARTHTHGRTDAHKRTRACVCAHTCGMQALIELAEDETNVQGRAKADQALLNLSWDNRAIAKFIENLGYSCGKQ